MFYSNNSAKYYTVNYHLSIIFIFTLLLNIDESVNGVAYIIML